MCRNKHMQVDLSELNLPLFIEDAEAVYESVSGTFESLLSSFLLLFISLLLF